MAVAIRWASRAPTLATSTTLPPRRPSNTAGRAIATTFSKDPLEGGDLGSREPHGWIVDEVHDIDAAVPQRGPYRCEELLGREVPRHCQPTEGIPDNQIVGTTGDGFEEQSGIADTHVEVGTGAEAQALPREAEEAWVDLKDGTGRTGPDGRKVVSRKAV